MIKGSDWDRKPFPEESVSIELNRHFDEAEMTSIRNGLLPEEIEIENSSINMGTAGFSAGILIDKNRIPIQFVYDRFLELVSDKQRRSYSISDDAYACYKDTIAEVPKIYDSKLVSNKVRVYFDEVTTDELRTILSASIKLAKYQKAMLRS